jgi:polyisoprenoid-binding protein YceI
MRLTFGLLIVSTALTVGCNKPAATGSGAPATPAAEGAAADGTADESSAAADTTEPAEGAIKFGPENAKIGFVAEHVGDKPDPRTGGFEKFTGEAELDAEGKALKSIKAEIDTTSLWTQFDGLTAHLNGADFLETQEHPTATFTSTKIEPGATDGEVTITGDLTLHGVTKEFTFPAKVEVKTASRR